MKDLEKALGKCCDGFAALADALPYTRLDKDGTAIIGLRELCADGKKPGLFLKWELRDWDSEADACLSTVPPTASGNVMAGRWMTWSKSCRARMPRMSSPV